MMTLEKDIYGELRNVKTHYLNANTYIIYEKDEDKGYRVIHYSLDSDSVYREDKW